MVNKEFEELLKNLNKEQREAVESIDGPVMVVAGPGTGKTQILSLRIGNILEKTDTPAESILCLTFTNSGVKAMKERLERYLGKRGQEISVSTFHSFAIQLIEKYFDFLDFQEIPKLLGDEDAVFLIDDILNENNFEHISPIANRVRYFGELKQLISLLKRERVTSEEFLLYIGNDIENLKNDPESVSKRGENKGEIKKEILKKIDSLERTKEVVEFYEIYEEKKKALSLMDYDDVLEYAVFLVENFEDIRADIRENYLYVLVDEHQDSSGVQNDFLKFVWRDVEKPNIFVVGDDRQLIYGFSGANLSYFEEFSHIFKSTKLIVLKENYRSTGPILSIADDLLKSSITNEKLNSNKNGNEKIFLSEYAYPRDEILGAGLYFKNKIEKGLDPSECALLLPRNYHVKTAISILSSMGLPVSSLDNVSLFDELEADYFRRVLGIIANPTDSILIANSLLDKTSGISPISAHLFLKSNGYQEISIDSLIKQKEDNLFGDNNQLYIWGKKLENWINVFNGEKLQNIVNILGNELLVNQSENNEEILRRVEIVRSFIHLAIMFEEKNKKSTLKDFIEYIDRLESYNSHIELSKFGNESGIKVMTLHKSKGLEYEAVWIAHMNEEILLRDKNSGFTLPEKIKEHINKRSKEEVKRELYVAITRAKNYCNISYSQESYSGGELTLVSVLKELPEMHFVKKNKEETEKEILDLGVDTYTKFIKKEYRGKVIDEVKELVAKHYSELKVSVSMLNNFFECSWKWYFRNFLRIPESKGIHLALGTVVHSVIEYILKQAKSSEAGSPDAFIKAFRDKLPKDTDIVDKIEKEFKKEGIDNKNDLKRLEKKAKEAVTLWIKNYYSNIEKDYKSERSITFRDKDFPNLLMYGKLDLTEYYKDGSIRVTDFKTGGSKTKGFIEKIDEEGRMSSLMRQLAMYTYLLQGDSSDAKVTNSRLLFLEEDIGNKNSLYETFVDQEKIDLLKRDIKDYEESLMFGNFVDNDCHFKSFGSNSSECEYCKLAKQLFQK
jgi:DNA helicase-2/ATP-dependent DNA helicase PcrA